MTRPGNGGGYTGMWERLGLDLKLHQELMDALGQLYPQIPSWWAPWERRC